MHHVHIHMVLQQKTSDGYTSATDWKRLRRDVSAVMESHTGKVRRDASAVMESHTGKAYRLLAAKRSTLHQLQTNHWIISFSEIRVAEQTWKL